MRHGFILKDGFRNIEEGEAGPECAGIAVFVNPEGCSCHISPPCHYCVENMPQCEKCGLYEIAESNPTDHQAPASGALVHPVVGQIEKHEG